MLEAPRKQSQMRFRLCGATQHQQNKIDSGNAGQFIDKPWIAVDIPRGKSGYATTEEHVDSPRCEITRVRRQPGMWLFFAYFPLDSFAWRE